MEYNSMRELNVNEIKAVSGGHWYRAALATLTFLGNLDYSNSSHNSNNPSSATNKL
jgi:hypothetical protein